MCPCAVLSSELRILKIHPSEYLCMQWDFTLRNTARPPPEIALVGSSIGRRLYNYFISLQRKGHVLRDSFASFNDFRHPLSLIFH